MRPRLRATLFLVILALLAGGVLAIVEHSMRSRIEANRTAATMRVLRALLPDKGYDNEPSGDVVLLSSITALGAAEPLPAYRARLGGQPVAAVLTVTAPDGYVGSIRLLVSVAADGRVLGARVIQHTETPGLGDGIEAEKSDWILAFNGRSARDPAAAGWSLQRDGGDFDQLTGATITSRAVVNAIHNALLYFDAHREEVFSALSSLPMEN
jgi:electron transport complex protein RnfG